jgi:uncharacterized membrane protein YkoI
MGRNDWERQGRLLHRWVGIAVVGFLLLSVGTGLLWANARFLYWDDHYKEKLHPLPSVSLDNALLPPIAIGDRVRSLAGRDITIDQVTLKSDFGALVYEVRVRQAKTKHVWLIDATTMESLSPISEGLASRIAQQYVRESAAITNVKLESYLPRKKHTPVEAIRVSFDDTNKTQIILDRYTGDILEDEGRWRRIHFMVMQLHQLNFFGFEKTLLNLPGIPLLLLGISGALIGALQWMRTRRARRRSGQQDVSVGKKILTVATER